MGMVLAHGIADNTGGLPVGAVPADPQLIHVIEGPPLDRLQAVPHVGKGPGDDDTHGVVDIGLLHEGGIFGFNDFAGGDSLGRFRSRHILPILLRRQALLH